jgi:hypothetical protein
MKTGSGSQSVRASWQRSAIGCKQNLEQPVNDRFGALIALTHLETSLGLSAHPESGWD